MKPALVYGKVRKGEGRGAQFGFPTANIPLHQHISEGVYVSTTRIGKRFYPSVTFVGVARTFGALHAGVETYILNWKRPLYGQWISVKLLEKIRSNKTFSSVSLLRKAIAQDVKKAKQYFQERYV